MLAYEVNSTVAICSTLKGVPSGTPYIEVDTLPDGSREAWVIDDNKVVIDRTRITVETIETAVQNLLNEVAQSKGYDNIDSCGKYCGYDNPYRYECEQLGAYAAACWQQCYTVLEDGITVDEVINQLPVYGGQHANNKNR